MEPMILFDDCDDLPRARTTPSRIEPDPLILQFRERLLNADYGDSIELRMRLLGELVCRSYLHQLRILGEVKDAHF